MPSDSSLFGIYQNLKAARVVLKKLKKSGFYKASLIHKSQVGTLTLENSRLSPFISIFLFALSLYSFFVLKPLSPLLFLLGLYFLYRALGGVDSEKVKRLSKLMASDETMIVAECSNVQAVNLLQILKNVDFGQAVTFLFRPYRKKLLDQNAILPSGQAKAEEQESEAKELAKLNIKVSFLKSKDITLLKRLKKSKKLITEIHQELTDLDQLEQSITLSVEWLLDNFYLIRGHIDDVLLNLPKNYYRELPKILSGPNKGLPRVYTIAMKLIEVTGGKLTQTNIIRFLKSYQEISPLNIGELWAMPLMLRLALIEVLRNLVLYADIRQREAEVATFWGNRLLNVAPDNVSIMDALIQDLKRQKIELTPHFAEEVLGQLFDKGEALIDVKKLLENELGPEIDVVLQKDQIKETEELSALSNAIKSLMILSQIEYRQIFHEVSKVDAILSNDPTDTFSHLSFPTLDLYRRNIERIAKHCPANEIEVARKVLELAENSNDTLSRHVGYYLIDDGKKTLEKVLNYKLSFSEKIQHLIKKYPLACYLGSVGLFVLLLEALLYFYTKNIPLLFFVLIPISEVAIQCLNVVFTKLLPPYLLPRMNFQGIISEEFKTLVVVPILLIEKMIQEELKQLEVHYLANPSPNIKYALFSDFVDHKEEVKEDDCKLLEKITKGIHALNKKYGEGTFFLFHRSRIFADSEDRYMGKERKRGKLEELNRYLLEIDKKTTPNILYVGKNENLKNIRFVLTVDADTQLPKESITRLIETAAHPLNYPVQDQETGQVTRGYTIIQPRMTTSLPSANATLFSRIFSGAAGADPYAQAISDIYQDLTLEGTYHGKGIYDLHMFYKRLNNRFPDAHILSHDLLEGAYVRVGFASAVELFDEFPESYLCWAKREHRWMRGDWQILDWLFKRVPSKKGYETNSLSGMNKWKIFDNVRRSLLAPSLFFLAIGTAFLAQIPTLWFSLIWLVLLIPTLSLILFKVFSLKQEITLPSNQITNCFLKALTFAAFLPHMAYNALDAIIRAIYRKKISKKRLLEWVQQRSQLNETNSYKLGFIPPFAVIMGLLTYYFNPHAVWPFLSFLFLWFFSPLIAKKMGQPISNRFLNLKFEEKKLLRQVARKTWRFFDTFTGADSNHLPPDNYQESHTKEVAYRTSPTNIGLYLLSIYSANDFGYITIDEAIKKSLETLNTLLKMEKYEGHLLNWYDIKTLEPLLPRYVSTVDSGNFLASLYALKYAVKSVCSSNILKDVYFKGLQDSLFFLPRSSSLKEKLKKYPTHLSAYKSFLKDLLKDAKKIQEENKEHGQEAEYWSEKFVLELESLNSTYNRYFEWMEILNERNSEDLKKMHPEAATYRQVAFLENISLEKLAKAEIAGLTSLLNLDISSFNEEQATWFHKFLESFSKAQWLAGEKLAEAHAAIDGIEKLSHEIEMKFLYNVERRLFSIGYNVTDHRLDSSYYDLLASEARLSSLLAIARNDVPVNHWWALGRPYAKAEGYTVLLSWGGTMFEYLMPLILSKSYEKSLLDNACKAAVLCQIAYAERKKIPWGISESAYCGVDARKTYQYRSFGVPRLGLKRGLEDDLVVSPYSTGLSLLIEPKKAISNLKKLMHEMHSEVFGKFGFFESIDYTRQYDDKGERGVIVRAYMAHHQGMIFTSLNNCLHDGIIQNHFHQDPRILSVEPLLYERLPASMPFTRDYTRKQPVKRLRQLSEISGIGRLDTPNSLTPKVNLLSNGNYSVMVTNSLGGFSKFNDMEITRWQADTVTDSLGSFIYMKDLESKKTWSVGYQPTGVNPDFFAVNFTPDKAEFIRRDHGIELKLEITVSPEDNVEIRRLTFLNLSKKKRYLEATSYMELVLNSHTADRMHPAYNKMFIETKSVVKPFGLMATRRKKAEDEPSIYVGYLFSQSGFTDSAYQFETDRRKFIGRGRDLNHPEALERDLTNTEGCVLDPIFSLRREVMLEPNEKAAFSFVLCVSQHEEKMMELMEKYHDSRACNRAFEMAWTYSQLQLRHLRILGEEAQYFQKLGGKLLYPQKQFRTSFQRVWNNRLSQSSLWAYTISGDLPILTVIIEDLHDLDLAKQVLVAHSFLNLRGLKCDLVFLSEEVSTYEQPLKGQLQRFIQSHSYQVPVDKSGHVYLLSFDQLPKEDTNLILSASRLVLIAARGLLQKQLVPELYPLVRSPLFKLKEKVEESLSPPLPFIELNYFNGFGGFTEKGEEYVIYLGPDQKTPAPWINVIANKEFGMIVSETGLGSTWYGNSQNNRLTPWSNDPVINPVHDAIYIRDNDLGAIWTITPSPIREKDAYRVRHGQGYSHFEHNSHGIIQNLTLFIPTDAPLRIQKLTLKNVSSKKRKLSLYSYSELVLGENKETSQLFTVSSFNKKTEALFFYNHYQKDYGTRTVFAASYPKPNYYTADRREFIGRNQSAKRPASLERVYLSNAVNELFDPCAALQLEVMLEPMEEKEFIFLFGSAENDAEAEELIANYSQIKCVETSFENVKEWWRNYLGVIEVEFPDLSLNYLMNKWLLYQNLSCRIFGRSAFYQSSGAYGFRDQLQDAMTALYGLPEISREQILRAAAHQFEEGDVQHWWHPISNAGIRTRISDDLLWLPFVTAHYVRVTGDISILNEEITFLEGPPLKDDEHENYFIPTISKNKATLLEHCRRAIKKGSTKGVHGIPLIGTGDWNDGMNRVGCLGKGESIWLGWFLIHALKDFTELLDFAKDEESKTPYLKVREEIARSIETHGFDGDWYLRAFFDDGTPLGSKNSEECQIDAIAQSWSVISGMADKTRSDMALNSAKDHLFSEEMRLLQLLKSPFNKTEHDPGYIKGYPPGIRENGAQYTHGSLWLPMAFARSGRGDEAINILQFMNPILQATNESQVEKYRVEPYILAADVYSNPVYPGMGGWTWYTGSAGWMYRIWLEEVIGFKLRGNKVVIQPVPQTHWKIIKLKFKFGKSLYHFEITQSEIKGKEFLLNDDGKEHFFTV